MSYSTESEEAIEGYKLQMGDYIVLTTPFGMEKAYKVMHVTRYEAHIKFYDNGKRRKFPRYYTTPFEPIFESSKKERKERINCTWTVRVNDIGVKKRLKI